MIKIIPTREMMPRMRSILSIKGFSPKACSALRCVLNKTEVRWYPIEAYIVCKNPIVAISKGDKPAPSKMA